MAKLTKKQTENLRFIANDALNNLINYQVLIQKTRFDYQNDIKIFFLRTVEILNNAYRNLTGEYIWPDYKAVIEAGIRNNTPSNKPDLEKLEELIETYQETGQYPPLQVVSDSMEEEDQPLWEDEDVESTINQEIPHPANSPYYPPSPSSWIPAQYSTFQTGTVISAQSNTITLNNG